MSRVWQVDDLPAWVRPNVTVDPSSGCFRVGAGGAIWVDRQGYAHIGIARIHRLVYIECVGPIPDETPVLDHVKSWGCRFRDCSLPSHLEPVTIQVNTLRGDTIAAINAAKTACSTCSTPYNNANTYVYPSGGRRDCRVCRAEQEQRRVSRRRAAAAIAAAQAGGYLFDLPVAA